MNPLKLYFMNIYEFRVNRGINSILLLLNFYRNTFFQVCFYDFFFYVLHFLPFKNRLLGISFFLNNFFSYFFFLLDLGVCMKSNKKSTKVPSTHIKKYFGHNTRFLKIGTNSNIMYKSDSHRCYRIPLYP